MTMTLCYVMVPCLVAMVMAAPVADEAHNVEQAVNVQGDSKVVDRAKRAKEEIVFGNQQNGARMGAAKKSVWPAQDPDVPMAPDSESNSNADRAGYVLAEKEQLLLHRPEDQPEPVEGGETQEEEVDQELPLDSVIEEGAAPSAEDASESTAAGEDVVQQTEVGSENNSVPAAVLEPEEQAPLVPSPPLNSKNADAEEALQGQEQIENNDTEDMENLLKELHDDDTEVSNEIVQEDEKEGEGEPEMASEEAELKQNEGDAMAANFDAMDPRMVKYMIMHKNQKERGPDRFNFLYPNSYYLQRRRRSLARRHLPRVYNHKAGKQLARAKRTKRDLFDDDLYNNQPQPDNAEQNNEAELGELIAYLMALYPSIYDNQPLPQGSSQYPGYQLYGPNSIYPEEAYPEYRQWEEPEYVEVPVGWEPSSQQVPAWEPNFYPEEVEEEPSYYPTPEKRQMLSMVPGQRRKKYFYPFAREPYTHWGAFVPSQEKRDYDQAYRRLKNLALVLADSRQSPSYLDALDDYRKK